MNIYLINKYNGIQVKLKVFSISIILYHVTPFNLFILQILNSYSSRICNIGDINLKKHNNWV